MAYTKEVRGKLDAAFKDLGQQTVKNIAQPIRVYAVSAGTEVGGVALAIDAKDDRAATWYEGFGALKLLDSPRQLVLPLATIAEAILAAKQN